jgi:hypothetical protein
MNPERANYLKKFEDAQHAVTEFDAMMQRVQKTGERIFAEAETIGALLAVHRLLHRAEDRRTAAPILLAKLQKDWDLDAMGDGQQSVR